MATTVVNLRGPGRAERAGIARVDRGTPWGNPFPMRDPSDGERARVIGLYRSRLARRGGLLRRRHELRGKRLRCWCAPKPCHADDLAWLAEASDGEVRVWIDAVLATEP